MILVYCISQQSLLSVYMKFQVDSFYSLEDLAHTKLQSENW